MSPSRRWILKSLISRPMACREICREKCGVVIMRKIAYIFQKITFSCCCLFIKETTLSLINDFQKMFKNVQKENVSKCSCDTTVRQNLQKIIWKSCLLLLERVQLQPPAVNHLSIYSFIYLLSFTERFEWGIAAVKLREFYAKFVALIGENKRQLVPGARV